MSIVCDDPVKAAIRLKRFVIKEEEGVYDDFDKDQFSKDCMLIQHAYLAEHREDDHEEITIEWLLDIGGWRNMEYRIPVIVLGGFNLFHEPRFGGWTVKVQNSGLTTITTRGELRLLFRATKTIVKKDV